jgi:hypothetical protein
MSAKSLLKVIASVTKGRENAYAENAVISTQFKKLVEYAILNRDERPVVQEDVEASKLISNAMIEIGYAVDVNVGRDIWELVSKDSQAQWLFPPESINGVYISLVNVAQNMASNQCYIEFTLKRSS